MSIRVAIVDDQPLFCSGLQMLFDSTEGFDFVGSAGDGAAGVALVAKVRPDVVLMDIRMPRMDGIAATTAILDLAAARGWTPPRIIMLTTFRRHSAVIDAIRSGADGFLMKDSKPQALLAAIRSVNAGEPIVAPAAFATSDSPARAVNHPRLGSLSARERDIFELAAKGRSNREIASEAFVSEATVKSHMSSILSKLGLTSRAQLVVLAFESESSGER